MSPILIAICLLAQPAAADGGAVDNGGIDFFENHIRPIFVNKCHRCHGDIEAPKGRLMLISRETVLHGGKRGPAAVSQDPDQSLLLRAVRHEGDLKMPPGGQLSPQEIEKLTQWVEMGLPWPRAQAAQLDWSGDSELIEKHRNFWSFRPPADETPPVVARKRWLRTPVDSFVLARLENAGSSPSPRASRRELIRRATYDLTGLPPTPEETSAFLNDPSPSAFSSIIDRLLASPAYGERWGRHWLDVARYADSKDLRSVGLPHDIVESYRYRDWVIQAFNKDYPYDDFVVDQIAGDLIQPKDPETPDTDRLIATGLLAIGCWGPGDSDTAKMHTDMVDDMINVVGRGFLGLTVGCARCHDHKFDPISSRDYYALAGIFFSTQIAPPGTSARFVSLPLVPKSEVDAYNTREKERTDAMAKTAKEATDLRSRAYDELLKRHVPETARYLLAAWDYANRATVEQELTPEQFVEKTTSEQSPLRADALAQFVGYLGFDAPEIMALSVLQENVDDHASVFAWRGEHPEPVAFANLSENPIDIGGVLSPGSFAVQSSMEKAAVVGWVSPLSGEVRIQGSIADVRRGCGDGVEWIIEHRRASPTYDAFSSAHLLGDVLLPGDTAPISDTHGAERIQRVRVAEGDRIHLVVLPRADRLCDLTRITFEIDEIDGQDRTWNLQRDLMKHRPALRAASEYGIGDVWRFSATPVAAAEKLANQRRAFAPALRVVKQDASFPFRQNRHPHLETPFTIAGENFRSGLFCASWNELEIYLPATGRVFRSHIGIDTNGGTAGGRGSVTFHLDLDGHERFASKVFHEGTAAEVIEIPLHGRPIFRLRVDDAGDFIHSDQGVWADARVQLEDGREIRLGDVTVVKTRPLENPRSVLADWFDAIDAADSGSADRELIARRATEIQATLDEVRAEMDRPAERTEDEAGQGKPGADNADKKAPERPHPLGSLAKVATTRLAIDLVAPESPFRIEKRDDKRLLSVDVVARLEKLDEEFKTLEASKETMYPVAMGAVDGGVPTTKYKGFNDVRVHVGGNYAVLGEVVPRGFPRVLEGDDPPVIPDGTSGRLQLARWIVLRDNPLTARVLVNRIWLHHFGEGLVRTPGNFGVLGQPPTHPRLLDYLANRFMDDGWSIKKMHRLIMNSAVYQQSGHAKPALLTADPDNRLLGRMKMRRLDAEAFRDTLVTVSGRLERSMGGPPGRSRNPDVDALSRRRAVYLMTNRSDKSTFRFLFDAADPENVVNQRSTSTVSPQAIFLLNSPFVLECANDLATRLLATNESNAHRITTAYELLYGRSPTQGELALGLWYLGAQTKTEEAPSRGTDGLEQAPEVWRDYCQTLLCANELVYLR